MHPQLAPGFFLKSLTPPLGSTKYFENKEDFSCIGMNAPLAWMLGQRKQTCLNPSIPDYWEAGSLKEGRLSLMAFKLLLLLWSPYPHPEVSC